MPDTATGQMWLSDGRHGASFEREYAAPPITVWDTVTRPEALARWFSPVSGDFGAGGRYAIDFGDDTGGGEIRTCEPPRLLAVTWELAGEAPSLLTITLEATPGGGTTLRLDHDGLPANQAAGHAAGWHAYLDRLDGALAGSDPIPWWPRWQEMIGSYREQHAAQAVTTPA